MLTLKQYLDESLNNPYNYKLLKFSNDKYQASFQSKSGKVNVLFRVDVYADSPEWSIHFTLDGKSDASGKGDAFRIFATVAAIVEEWIDTLVSNKGDSGPHPIGAIDLMVSKLKLDDGSNEKTSYRGRTALYKRFGKKIADVLGSRYVYNVIESNDKIAIEIKRKKLKLRR